MSVFALGRMRVRRSGYGAMQLAGQFAAGTPPDRESAIGVLRAAVAAGVDHIDTAQYYGPGTVNALIRDALYPYPDGLAIVSKVAAGRDDSGTGYLRAGIEDNLRSLRSRPARRGQPPPARRRPRGCALRRPAGRDGGGPRRGSDRRDRPEQHQPGATAACRRGHRDRLRAEPVPPGRPHCGAASRCVPAAGASRSCRSARSAGRAARTTPC